MSEYELYHYGVLGMKWGVRRARKNGAEYKYTSHGTKTYAKKAAKYRKKGDAEKAKRYEEYHKKSTELDDKMLDYAKSVRTGKDYVKNMLVNSRGYRVTKLATGNSRYVSRGLAFVSAAYPDLGDQLTRAAYVRGYISDNTGRKVEGAARKQLKRFRR